jgi:hypothetical protein
MSVTKVFNEYLNVSEIGHLRTVQDVQVTKRGKEVRKDIGSDIVFKNTNSQGFIRFLGKTKAELFAEIQKQAVKCK